MQLKIGYLFQCPPWVGYHRISPCALKGQKFYKAPCFAHFLDKISDVMKPHHIFSNLF